MSRSGTEARQAVTALRDDGQITLRPAGRGDLDALEALETAVFETDRISRRSFARFLSSPSAWLAVAVAHDRTLAGYALLLFRRGTALARLYSIAVAPGCRGRGVGLGLMEAAEAEAYERGCIFLRLEVREDNAAAVALYRARGYRQFGRYIDYYEDHADALRFEKRLSSPARGRVSDPAIPYFEQTLDFTCAPACIAMVLAWSDREIRPGLELELALWREATTIFMTSGHGGCEPFGIAVALARRGLVPEIRVNRPPPYFIEGVRSQEKRMVMLATEAAFRREADALGVGITIGEWGPADIVAALDGGALVMVLVSGYRMFSKKVPHWLLVIGHDSGHVFVHDPWVEDKHFETATAAANLPIPFDEFYRMARYGRDGLRAAVIIRKGRHP